MTPSSRIPGMNGWTFTMAWALALGITAGAAAAQEVLPPPAAAPRAAADTRPEPAPPARFENGEPMDGFFTALAVRYGVMVLQPKPVQAYILKSFDMPDKLEEALALARQTLEPQGFSILQSVVEKRLVIRIVTTREAKLAELAESPVSFGPEGEKIDVSKPDRPVTHLLPINHPDMLEALRRTALQDPEVSVEATGGTAIGVNLIFTGPALKVQRAVETVAKLDKPVGGPIVARTLALQHLNAETTANSLNTLFTGDTAPLKAVVDRRTNSIIVTGPEERVVDIMVTLVGQDAKQGPILPPPPPVPAITPPGPVMAPQVPPTSRPGAEQPGARRDATGGDRYGFADDFPALPVNIIVRLYPESLDEFTRGGDNAPLYARLVICAHWAHCSLFVNKGAFL
jgi:hypothetical protein